MYYEYLFILNLNLYVCRTLLSIHIHSFNYTKTQIKTITSILYVNNECHFLGDVEVVLLYEGCIWIRLPKLRGELCKHECGGLGRATTQPSELDMIAEDSKTQDAMCSGKSRFAMNMHCSMVVKVRHHLQRPGRRIRLPRAAAQGYSLSL